MILSDKIIITLAVIGLLLSIFCSVITYRRATLRRKEIRRRVKRFSETKNTTDRLVHELGTSRLNLKKIRIYHEKRVNKKSEN